MFHKGCEYSSLSLLLTAENVSREIRLSLAQEFDTGDVDMSGIWSTGTDWSTFIFSNSIFFLSKCREISVVFFSF